MPTFHTLTGVTHSLVKSRKDLCDCCHIATGCGPLECVNKKKVCQTESELLFCPKGTTLAKRARCLPDNKLWPRKTTAKREVWFHDSADCSSWTNWRKTRWTFVFHNSLHVQEKKYPYRCLPLNPKKINTPSKILLNWTNSEWSRQVNTQFGGVWFA